MLRRIFGLVMVALLIADIFALGVQAQQTKAMEKITVTGSTNASYFFDEKDARDSPFSEPRNVRGSTDLPLGSNDWYMFQRENGHSGSSEIPGPKSGSIWWKQYPGDNFSGELSSPIVMEGNLYIGAIEGVYCFDAQSGRIRWGSNVGWIRSTPAFYGGRIFASSQDGNMYCLNATDGSQIWKEAVGNGTSMSSPAICDGTVYVGSATLLWYDGWGEHVNATLCALDTRNGELLWKRLCGDGPFDSSPAVANGIVYASPWATMFAFNASSGETVWTLGLGGAIKSSPTIVSGILCIPCMDHKIYALNATTGDIFWTNDGGIPATPQGYWSTPCAGNGMFYVSSMTHIGALDQFSGNLNWTQQISEDPQGEATFASPAFADGLVYTGSFDRNDTVHGNVYAFNASTGDEIWKIENTGLMYSSPALAYETLYIGVAHGILYAFKDLVHIKADGSIEPPTTSISSDGNITYTFTNDLINSVIVERDDIVVQGAGHKLLGAESATGISITGRRNVTILDLEITGFQYAVVLNRSSSICLNQTKLSNNQEAVRLEYASNNTIVENFISANGVGLYFINSTYNRIFEDTITSNYYAGCVYFRNSTDNLFWHNSLLNNTVHARDVNQTFPLPNIWDNGYPAGGNYWSNYTGTDLFSGPYQNETGSDGIGDIPHTIYKNNSDSYPLLGPWTKVGYNITIMHASGVSTIFTQVNTSGITTVNKTQTGANPPKGFRIVTEPPTYYDIETTAGYSGSIMVRIEYDDSGMSQLEEASLRLLHWNSTAQQWDDVTTQVDSEANVVYGISDSLSPFTIITRLLGDINYDGTIDIYDAILLASSFNCVPGSSNWKAEADINHDSMVDIYDAIILANHYNQQYP